MYYTIQAAKKGADQTARMRRLICAFVVRIWHKQIFSTTWLKWFCKDVNRLATFIIRNKSCFNVRFIILMFDLLWNLTLFSPPFSIQKRLIRTVKEHFHVMKQGREHGFRAVERRHVQFRGRYTGFRVGRFLEAIILAWESCFVWGSIR